MRSVIIISRIDHDALSVVTQLAERGCIPEVILLSEAVYMLTSHGKYINEIKNSIKLGATFYALSEDIIKRGIERLLYDIKKINYNNFVDILLEKSKQIINL